MQQLRVEKKRKHPWEEVETEQRFDKDWNTVMANCRKCGLEGLVIGLHCLRISDRFSDRDKVLCCACIEENKKKKTTKYKSFWTNGMVHRLQQEEDELDRLEEEEKKRKLEVDMLNVVNSRQPGIPTRRRSWPSRHSSRSRRRRRRRRSPTSSRRRRMRRRRRSELELRELDFARRADCWIEFGDVGLKTKNAN